MAMPAQHRPMAGFGVLVTRPAEQAEGLCRIIEEAGGEAVRLPLLEIVAQEPQGESAQWLRRLSDVDWVIFVSVNAVRHGWNWFEAGPKQGPRPKIAAIGQATAEALERRGVAVDLTPKQQFNSEALLALAEFADVAGRRFLIVRGAGGREMLAQTLRLRGAEVAYAEVYRRILPPIDVDGLIARWRAGGIRATVITSGEALSNLALLLDGKGMDLLTQTPLIAISERLAEQARALGCRSVATTAAASDEAIAESVISLGASR